MNNNILLSSLPLSELVGEIAKAVRDELATTLPISVPEQEALLTREEAADLLHITLPTLSQHTHKGKLQGYRIGARVLYKRSELLEALQLIQSRNFRRL